jgi:hypothetical protein
MQRIQAHQLLAMPSDADEAVERWAAEQPPSRTASCFSLHLNRSPHLAILPSHSLTHLVLNPGVVRSAASHSKTGQDARSQKP